MLQASPNLTPSRIYRMLERSAIDMNEPGFDFDTGYGYVNGLLAVKRAVRTGDNEASKAIKPKMPRSAYCYYTEEGDEESNGPQANY